AVHSVSTLLREPLPRDASIKLDNAFCIAIHSLIQDDTRPSISTRTRPAGAAPLGWAAPRRWAQAGPETLGRARRARSVPPTAGACHAAAAPGSTLAPDRRDRARAR